MSPLNQERDEGIKNRKEEKKTGLKLHRPDRQVVENEESSVSLRALLCEHLLVISRGVVRFHCCSLCLLCGKRSPDVPMANV